MNSHSSGAKVFETLSVMKDQFFTRWVPNASSKISTAWSAKKLTTVMFSLMQRDMPEQYNDWGKVMQENEVLIQVMRGTTTTSASAGFSLAI
jgi:hypothetical protein